VELSEVALGTWGLSGAYGPISPSLFQQTLEAAREAGITTFDTAPLWGEGQAEERIGEVLCEKQRDEIQIITRAGVVIEDDEVVTRYDTESLKKDLEASLERLKTDHVDVWLLHDPPEEALHEDEIWELVEELKKEKTIRAFGISARGVDEARVAIEKKVDAICLTYNLLKSDDLKDLETDLEEEKIGVIARSPLFHGLLSGRWTEYRQFAQDDQRKGRWTQTALAVRVRQVNRLRYLVHDGVPNLSAAALRYVLAHGSVTSAVLGARRPVQVSGVRSMAGEPPYLPADDLDRIQRILADAGA